MFAGEDTDATALEDLWSFRVGDPVSEHPTSSRR